MLTIALICLGIAIGKWLFPQKWQKANARLQTLLTILLIFAMGVSIGRNDGLLQNLATLGLDSALFCLLAMAASILLVYLATRKLLPRKKAG